MMKTSLRVTAFVLSTLSLISLTCATDLVETAAFDISGDQNNPTAFPLTLGANNLTATTGGLVGTVSGGSTNGNDAEYLAVTVPAGASLDSVVVTAYEHPQASSRSFIAYESGSTTLSAPVGDYLTGAAPAPINELFGAFDLGNSVFTDLGSGPFAFWIQETNMEASTYTLTFNVVPEPLSAALLFAACAAILPVVRRRR